LLTTTETRNLIEELRNNIQSQDAIKARLILEHLPEVDARTRLRALFELARGEESFVVPILAELLLRADQLKLDYQQVFSLLIKLLWDHPELLLEILQDENIPDKKPFIQLAGQVQCRKTLPIIASILNQNSDPEINKVCILALGKIGEPQYITTISDFLYSGNLELTTAAIQALKLIGNDEAVMYLAKRLGTDTQIDRLIIDSLAEIQTEASIRKINELLASHDPHLRNYAKDKLVELGVKAVPILIKNLEQEDPDVLIHTLNVLGLIGDASAARPIRQFLFKQPQDANVRFAAYEALGMLPIRFGAFTLIEGLIDPEEQVRLACARALNKNSDETILMGIQNLIEEENPESEKIVEAILNSESDEIFRYLIDHPPFRHYAFDYLSKRATEDIRNHFIRVLQKMGRNEIARQLMDQSQEAPSSGEFKIFVVDDSRMILRLYKSTLFKLGYSAHLFEFPESALEKVQQDKPDLIFTDLNMPGMNGVELTRAIRQIYSPEELPIIMVTTQQDIEDRNAALESGVNNILYKPFREEQLKEMIERYLQKPSS